MRSWTIASEWVGILSSHGPSGADLCFAPGGIAHAFDPITRTVACGADAERLEVFHVDFGDDDWSMRCEDCVRLASGTNGPIADRAVRSTRSSP